MYGETHPFIVGVLHASNDLIPLCTLTSPGTGPIQSVDELESSRRPHYSGPWIVALLGADSNSTGDMPLQKQMAFCHSGTTRLHLPKREEPNQETTLSKQNAVNFG